MNNAGISAFGDVEWTSVNIYKRVSTHNLKQSNIKATVYFLVDGCECMGGSTSHNSNVATNATYWRQNCCHGFRSWPHHAT